MATLNPFDILGSDDGDDPSKLVAAAAAVVAAQPKKAAPTAGKSGPQPTSAAANAGRNGAAKVQTNGERDAQGVRPQRATYGRAGAGRGDYQGRGNGGRGPGSYQGRAEYQVRSSENSKVRVYEPRDANVENRVSNSNGNVEAQISAGTVESNGSKNSESERPPRRMYDRRSGTGYGSEMKRNGAGRHNWGTYVDDTPAQESEEAVKVDEIAVEDEKLVDQEQAPQEDDKTENKEKKEKGESEKEEEEDKEMTLEEYEKMLEEKRKALSALKAEERKVKIDKELQSMQVLSTKKGTDEVFVKLGNDKESLKKKEGAEAAERAKKSVSINEFLKPAEGQRYNAQGRGRGRGRGFYTGGGYSNGGYRTQAAAPKIEDQTQFPTLVAK